MAVTAQSVIQRAVITLQDPTSVRWPVNELVRYLNDGQREIIMHRPDAMVTNATVALVAGTKQSIPATGTKLIEVIRNSGSGTTKKAVRLITREVLDAQSPGWHNLTGVAEVLHYMFDPRDPKVFYVYPPSTGTNSSVEVVYSALPTDINEPADGSLYTAVSGNISVPDIYANALLDYILYRAYIKDAEYAGNAARASAHYTQFANSLGIELKGTLGAMPTTNSNPNVPSSMARAANAA